MPEYTIHEPVHRISMKWIMWHCGDRHVVGQRFMHLWTEESLYIHPNYAYFVRCGARDMPVREFTEVV